MSRRHRASCPSKNRQKKNAVERFHSVFLLVRVTGLEPARRGHQNLNLARLPIPPYPRVRLVYPFCGYLSILMMVLIGSGPLAKRKELACPAGAQEGDNLRFSPSCESSSFPWRVWRRPETGDRFEIGERQSGYRSVYFVKYSQFTDSVLLHMRLTPRRRGITVPRNPLARCNGRHLRI